MARAQGIENVLHNVIMLDSSPIMIHSPDLTLMNLRVPMFDSRVADVMSINCCYEVQPLGFIVATGMMRSIDISRSDINWLMLSDAMCCSTIICVS